MKYRVLLFVALSVVLSILPAVAADEDDLPAEARAAIESARKNAEKAGVTLPELKQLMSEDSDETEEAKEKAKKISATKPEPLKELPAWIPAIAGFKPAAGSGKHRIDESGKEIGTMSGMMAGAPRDAAKSFAETMRPRFAGVTTNDVTVNGNLTMTVFVSDGKAEDEEHKIEFELKPIADGKSSRATLTYTQPAMPEKNRSAR